MAEPIVVAVVIDPVTNERYDLCWTWEAGQNYAQQGYIVKATRADGHMDVAQAQRLYDYERDCFMDCFARTEPFSHG